MDYKSNDLLEYPGSDVVALKVDFETLHQAAGKLGIAVTHTSDGSFYSPSRRLINIDTKTPNRQGFVPVGQLADEYLHAWNQCYGRGHFLDQATAAEHLELGRIAEATGTRSLGSRRNCAFHQLEALNFVMSGHEVPPFIWRAPFPAVRQFAYSWQQHYR